MYLQYTENMYISNEYDIWYDMIWYDISVLQMGVQPVAVVSKLVQK